MEEGFPTNKGERKTFHNFI